MFKKKFKWIPIYNYQYGYDNYLVQSRISSDGLISFKTTKITGRDGERDDEHENLNLGLNPLTQFQKLIKQNEKQKTN
jgi:hypothetical protein